MDNPIIQSTKKGINDELKLPIVVPKISAGRY
jgi:hypothetical protein